ncbi:hypothetical protein BH11MYX2_BH11MYX2_03130 [soil metagenome]
MTVSRIAIGFAFVTGSLLTVGACGDDGGGNTVVDARPDTGGGSDALPPDAPPRVVDFGSDEGGEVRLEWIKFPNGNTGARGTAFFYKDPGTTKFWPFLSLDGCTDLTGLNGHDKWPKAQNANREYFDVGPYVNVSGAFPATGPLVISKTDAAAIPAPPGRDPVGRLQPAGSWYFNAAAGTDMDGDALLPSDTFYDVTLPGSATYAGHTYDKAVYMPGDMTPMSPAFNATPIPAPATGDMTFVFNNATSHPPNGPDGQPIEVQNLIAFTAQPMVAGTATTFGPAVICIKKQEAGATTTVTVPAAFVTIARTAYPNGGQLARQTVVHNVKELVDGAGAGTGRRIDMLGVWCYAGQQFSVPAN